MKAADQPVSELEIDRRLVRIQHPTVTVCRRLALAAGRGATTRSGGRLSLLVVVASAAAVLVIAPGAAAADTVCVGNTTGVHANAVVQPDRFGAS